MYRALKAMPAMMMMMVMVLVLVMVAPQVASP
jgi:hypothetical protein